MQDVRTSKARVVAALAFVVAACLVPAAQATTIPYLSHGVGVDKSQFSSAGVQAPIPDAFERAVLRLAKVRPDDRSGIRGIGSGEVASNAAVGSPAGTDWQAGLARVGGMLALAVLLAAGIVLNRRHKQRVVAHH